MPLLLSEPCVAWGRQQPLHSPCWGSRARHTPLCSRGQLPPRAGGHSAFAAPRWSRLSELSAWGCRLAVQHDLTLRTPCGEILGGLLVRKQALTYFLCASWLAVG